VSGGQEFDVSERYFESQQEPKPDDECESAQEPSATAQPSLEALADLLDQLVAFIRQYVVMSPAQVDAAALWIVHTHAVEAAETTLYLAVNSVEKRSGKSRLLEVLGLLVARPLATANISDAALFRAIAERSPTLLFDEVDAIFGPKARDREDLRALLNAGYRRGGYVYRMGGAKMTTLEPFEVFCPKALAGIGRLPDTVADRSIPLVMKRKAPGESVKRFRRREVDPSAEALRGQVEEWAQSHIEALMEARPEIPAWLDDRAADGWESLLAISDHAESDWPDRARRAALELSASEEREDDSFGVQLLADIHRAFEDRSIDRLATSELLDTLAADDEAPWADWHGKGKMSPRSLAALLKPYEIRSRSVRLDSGETPKGYLREQFEDAWRRYLPSQALQSATTPQPASLTEKQPDSICHTTLSVADAEEGANPHEQRDVADVADKAAGNGDAGPGEADFLELIDHAWGAGQITDQERRERRRLHLAVSRAYEPDRYERAKRRYLDSRRQKETE
jgi:hypothetical protein